VAIRKPFDCIRNNTRDGEGRLVCKEPGAWVRDPQGDDLAIADLTDDLNVDTDEIVDVSERSFCTEKLIRDHHFGLGEDVFMIGMFANDDLSDRNHPVARFGNLGRLAHPEILIKQKTGSSRPCHLVDMRSRTGFSGSPVFVYRYDDHVALSITDPNKEGWGNGRCMFLLGVHCGQYNEGIEARKMVPVHQAVGDPIVEGDTLKSPAAMNTVVPVWRITEMLDMDKFAKIRTAREKSRQQEALTHPSAEATAAEESSDSNPEHREAFNHLLGAAAKKKPQGD
jgi:hypothetical protein